MRAPESAIKCNLLFSQTAGKVIILAGSVCRKIPPNNKYCGNRNYPSIPIMSLLNQHFFLNRPVPCFFMVLQSFYRIKLLIAICTCNHVYFSTVQVSPTQVASSGGVPFSGQVN